VCQAAEETSKNTLPSPYRNSMAHENHLTRYPDTIYIALSKAERRPAAHSG